MWEGRGCPVHTSMRAGRRRWPERHDGRTRRQASLRHPHRWGMVGRRADRPLESRILRRPRGHSLARLWRCYSESVLISWSGWWYDVEVALCVELLAESHMYVCMYVCM